MSFLRLIATLMLSDVKAIMHLLSRGDGRLTTSVFDAAQSWLASLAPVVANNTFLNLAKGATESNFYAHCLHDTLPHDQGVDLVIVEFAINDLPFDARVTPYMDNSKRCGPHTCRRDKASVRCAVLPLVRGGGVCARTQHAEEQPAMNG